jgi:hypothetical protein
MTDAQHAAARRPEPALRRLGQSDRDVLLVWLASRASLFVVAGAAGWLLIDTDARVLPWFDRWARWDFVHFRGIAELGYGGEPTGVPNEAFFPGLPGLLWLGGLIGLPAVVTGLAVSLIAGAVAAVALGRLGDLEGGPGVGRLAVVAWVFAPPAVFLAAPYTESLFLALAVPSWLAARRGRWAYAGLLAAGACTVRVSGVFLVVALVVEWVTVQVRARRSVLATPAADAVGELPPRRDGSDAWSVLWLLTPVVPLVAWMAYLRWLTGDWLAWLNAQAEEWNRTFTWPWDALGHTWDAAFGGAYSPVFSWMFRAEIVAVLIGIALTAALLWWRRWGEATWIGLQVAAFATSYWFFSVPRATLLWWPLWIAFAILAARRRWVLWAYLALSVPLMAIWAATFLTGRWAG